MSLRRKHFRNGTVPDGRFAVFGLGDVTNINGVVGSPISQWDGATTVSVVGSNFSTQTAIQINGVSYITTFINHNKVTATIPDASTPGSLLQTAGTISIGINNVLAGTLSISPFGFNTPPGLTMLFDPDPSNITIGTGVSQWNDTSGYTSRVATMATAANQPTYISSVSQLNNHPGLLFDGLNDTMSVSTQLRLYRPNNECTRFAVCCPMSITLNSGTIYANHHLISESSAGDAFILKTANGNSIGYLNRSTTDNYAAVTSNTITTGIIVEGYHSQNFIGCRKGLTSYTILASDDSTITGGQTFIGSRGTAYYYNGYVAHLLCYSAKLIAADSDRIMRKLKAFYNI